jgi:Ca2+/Na+ antiporter
LLRGATWGRVVGIVAGVLGAIGALFSIGGRYPWWSLAVFFLCIYVVYGILIFGEDESAPRA